MISEKHRRGIATLYLVAGLATAGGAISQLAGGGSGSESSSIVFVFQAVLFVAVGVVAWLGAPPKT